jgi:hypothetical protein
MIKFLGKVVIVLVVFVLALILCRQTIGIWITQSAIEKVTGCAATIKVMDIKINSCHVIARDTTMFNPKDFSAEPLIMKLDLVDTYYDPMSMMSGEPRFEKLVLDIREVRLVRNKEGKINLDQLKSPSNQKSKFKVDQLVLSLGDLVFIDEKHNPSKAITYKIRVTNKVYENIHSSEDLKKIVLGLIARSLPQNLVDMGILSDQMKGLSETFEKGRSLFDRFKGQK